MRVRLKKKKSRRKRNKDNLNIRNIAIVSISIIMIIIGISICFKTDKKMTPSGIEVVETKIKDDKEITEEEAKKVAVKQFKKLNEKVNQDELKILKIQRSGEEYYYITSSQNSLEIKIKGGQITRINSASVEE